MLAVLSFILLLVCVILMVVRRVMNNPEEDATFIAFYGSMKTVIYVVGLVSLVGFLQPGAIVHAGNQGLIFTLGKVTGTANPGFVWKCPFIQEVKSITTKPMQLNIVVPVGTDGASTKDNQTVGSHLTVFYMYNKDKIKAVYQEYGEERLQNVVSTSAIESFKTEVGKHGIFDIPVTQGEIQTTFKENLVSKVASYPITITDTKIINWDWSTEFDNQIKATMEKAQQVKQKQQELLMTEQEAQKKVKQATADKEAQILAAQGDSAAAALHAYAKIAEGEGIRKYNLAVQQSMSMEIEFRKLAIEQTKAERWNGQYVPVNHYGPIPVSTAALQPAQ